MMNVRLLSPPPHRRSRSILCLRPRAPLPVLLLNLIGMLACFGQGTITFDGPPIIPPGSDIGVTNYYEAGMLFRPIGDQPGVQFGRVGSGDPRDPDNGTAYLRAAIGDSLQFSFTNGAAFDLVGVDPSWLQHPRVRFLSAVRWLSSQRLDCNNKFLGHRDQLPNCLFRSGIFRSGPS
jgi:hypothetical protein